MARLGRILSLAALIVLGVVIVTVVKRGGWSPPLKATPRATTKTFMVHLGHRELPDYREAHGRWPSSLAELKAGAREPEFVPVVDAWKRPLGYFVEPDERVTLISLGADGRFGGEGDDADIRWPQDF